MKNTSFLHSVEVKTVLDVITTNCVNRLLLSDITDPFTKRLQNIVFIWVA